MKIYIDDDFKCHITNDGTMREIETDFFDGKCKTFIEGYRYVPLGETWVRSDGVEFHGEMISPVKDFTLLETHQSVYEEVMKETKKEIDSLNETYSTIQADTDAMLVDYEYRLTMMELGLTE